MYLLIITWQRCGESRVLAWLIAAAFLVRLGTGIFFSLALPAWGNDQPVQNAGYLFYDAYRRDGQAWTLASSGAPLWMAFTEEFTSDQYGGLLSLSAAIYRYLSPDAHRPYLILILGSLVFALGVSFFYRAAQTHAGLSERSARIASWIFVLYPDGILYTSSQMREPFLIGLSAIAFWLAGELLLKPRQSWLKIGLNLLWIAALMAGISSRAALFILAALAAWIWIELLQRAPSKSMKIAGLGLLGAGTVILLGFTWQWLRTSAAWDALLAERASGRVQVIFETLADILHFPFLIAYGLAQPVLPAVIAAPAVTLWKITGILRALGWYMLAPLLVYGMFSLWKIQAGAQRRFYTWLAGITLFWLLLASARAGGDQWDNPRYRITLLVWLTLLAGWALEQAWQRRDAWLWRWLAVEGIFIAFFTQWYLSRYLKIWGRLQFWQMAGAILGLSALVLMGGWLWDRRDQILAIFAGKQGVSPPRRTDLAFWRTAFLSEALLVGWAVWELILIAGAENFFETSAKWRLLEWFSPALPLIFIFLAGITYTSAWMGILRLLEQGILWLQRARRGWLVHGLLLVAFLTWTALFPYLILGLGKYGRFLEPLAVRLSLAGLWALPGAVLLRAALPGAGKWNRRFEALIAALLLPVIAYRVALLLPQISNFPFSLDWSEGTWLYNASLYFSQSLYGLKVPWAYLHPARYLLQSLLFIVPDLPIWVHRLYQVILWIILPLLTSILLARRLRLAGRFRTALAAAFAFLFLFQGPVYYHLTLCVSLVLVGFQAHNFRRSLVFVILASLWAGLSRVNWIPVPALLTVALYLIERRVDSDWKRYLREPFFYTLTGGFTALASMWVYNLLSGNDPGVFTSSYTSPMLWQRLLPNATFPQGILPSILIVSAPLAVGLILRLVRERLHWLRTAGLAGILAVFFAGGVVVSVKIGGGNNLHNLDAFLVFLLVIASHLLLWRFQPEAEDTPPAPAFLPFHPLVGWKGALAALVLVVPVGWTLLGGKPFEPIDVRQAYTELGLLEQILQQGQSQGEVLFIRERQLLTFRLVSGVRLSPQYEVVELMEMVMAGNQPYLDQFHADLKRQRYAMIVTDKQDPTPRYDKDAFSDENNLWVQEVSIPLLDSYRRAVFFPVGRVEVFVPK